MRAALYLRVSTDQQAERYSLPAQRRLLVEHCEREGWEYAIYEDAGISGETITARPAMRRLLEDVLARKVDIVLAVEMERFSRARDGVDLAVIKRVFREASVRFGTPAQLFDPDDVEDDFVSGLLGLLAAREKAKIIERTSRGRVESARRGRYVSGHAPYGYCRTTDGHLAVYEPEADAVRFMFRWLADGRSLLGIVDDLNAHGFRPRRAARWTKGSVHGILKNPAYSGTSYYRRTRAADRSGCRRQVRPETDWVAIPVPRVVTEDLVRIVHTRLEENALMAARNKRHFWLLKGLVECGVCGHRMSGKVGGGGRYYSCQAARAEVRGLAPRCRWHAVSAVALDSWVWGQVMRALQSPALVLEEARRARDARVGERDEFVMRLAYLEKTLTDLPRERERVQTLYREGYATFDEIKTQLAAVDRKRDALRDEKKRLLERLGERTVDEAQAIRMEEVVARVRDRLDKLTPQEQFEAIHAIVARIVVHVDRRVEIDACVPLGEGAAPRSYVRTQWDEHVVVASGIS